VLVYGFVRHERAATSIPALHECVASSLTLSSDPRRIAWRALIEKNISTRFSPDPDDGVKCGRADLLDRNHFRDQKGVTQHAG
jgi:hypothetical protein